MAPTLGVALPHYDASVPGTDRASGEVLVRAARLAEDLGFTTGWVSDHFTLPLARYGLPDRETAGLECWTALSAVAASTMSLRVGSLVLAEAFRPVGVLAKMVATLDRLSAGRVEVGLGAGWQELEYIRHGFPFAAPGERLARLEEYVVALRAALAGSPATVAGERHRLDEAWTLPGPVQSPCPPVWVGGSGDRLLGVAARVADGWNFGWRVSDELLDDRLAVLHRRCEESGRDPASMRVSLCLYCRFEQPAQPDGLVGSVEQVRDRLGRLGARGVEHVVLSPGPMPFSWPSDDWARSVAQSLL